MARKTKAARAGLTVAGAAAKLGISAAGIRNWLKEEKALARAVHKEDGVTVFPPAAIKILDRIRVARFKRASPALKIAWAKRRARAGKPRAKAAAPRSRKAIRAGLEKAWAARRAKAAARRAAKASGAAAPAAGVSGQRAAKLLGTNKVKLYELIKRYGIKKPRAARSFTPDVIEQIRKVLQGGKAAAGRAVPAVREMAGRVASRDEVSQALSVIRQAVDGTVRVATEFRQTMQRVFDQQVALIEKATRPIRIKLEE